MLDEDGYLDLSDMNHAKEIDAPKEKDKEEDEEKIDEEE